MTKKKSLSNHIILKIKGFGLIELVISIALINILILAMGKILMSSNSLMNNIKNNSNDISELNNTLNYIISDIDRAEYFIIPENMKFSEYTNNIVFIRKNQDKDTYYLYGYDPKQKSIIRFASTQSSFPDFYSNQVLKGKNIINDDIKEFKSEYNSNNNLIYFYIEDNNKNSVKRTYHIKANKL